MRVVVVVVGLVLVLNLAFFVGRSSDTSDPERDPLPASVESVTPRPGTQADRRAAVSVDLQDGLTGVLFIDGQRVPEDQLEYSNPQGIVTFRPGEDKDLESFEPGEHTAGVCYWSQTENQPVECESAPSFQWRFRATA
jgi:hypothetical protein